MTEGARHLPTPESHSDDRLSAPAPRPQQRPVPQSGSVSAPLHRENNFIKDFPQLADGLLVIPLPVEEQCRGVLSEPLPNLQLLTGKTHCPVSLTTHLVSRCISALSTSMTGPPGLPVRQGQVRKRPAISWAPTLCCAERGAWLRLRTLSPGQFYCLSKFQACARMSFTAVTTPSVTSPARIHLHSWTFIPLD